MGSIETQNYINLHLLLVGTVPSILRKFFKEMWQKCYGKYWQNTPEDGIELIHVLGNYFYNKEMRIQKVYMISGDINKWDLSLLVRVITQLHHGQKSSPKEKSNSKLKSLETLVNIKNMLSHIGYPAMSTEECNSNWKIIADVLKEFKVTEEELKKAIFLTADPSLPHSRPENAGEMLEKILKIKEEGNKLLEKGNIEGAIDLYSKALLFDNIPPEEQALIYSNRSKGFLDLETPDIERAIEDAVQVINLRPRWWKGYVKAALAYEASDDLTQAIKFYSIGLALNTNIADIEIRLCVCQFRKSLKEIDPKYLYRSVHECIQTHLKETLSTEENISEKVVEETKKKLKSEDSYMGFIIKGHLYRAAGKYEDAKDFFYKASIFRRNEAEAMFNLAMLEFNGKNKQKKNIENTVLLLQAAAAQNVENVSVIESQFILGLFYQVSMKDYDKAIFWYEKCAAENGLAAHQLAIMNYEGIGIAVNKKNAIIFWKSAAGSKQKVVAAMESLARHYLENRKFELAEEWHAIAVKNGSKLLSEGNDAFKKDFDELFSDYLKYEMCKLLEENGYNSTSTSLKMNMDTKVNRMLERHFNYIPEDKYSPVTHSFNVYTASYSLTTYFCYTEETIRKLKVASLKGNTTAQMLLDTKEHYLNAVKILMSFKWKDEEISFVKMIQEMASAIRLEHSFIYVVPQINSMFWDILKLHTPKEDSQISEHERDIRVCFCYFSATGVDRTNFDLVLSYCKEASQRYPNEAYFHYMVGSMYAFKKDYAIGVEEMKKSLEIIPNHYMLLHNKAGLAKYCPDIPRRTVIQEFLQFIKYAPIGNRIFADAHYDIVILYAQNGLKHPKNVTIYKDTHRNVAKYFKLGQQAEHTLAPYYLPYSGIFLEKKKHAEEIAAAFSMNFRSKKL